MAYELTFYLTWPGRSYSETSGPRSNLSGAQNKITSDRDSPVTILIEDDDPLMHQIGGDGTPARLAEDLTVPDGPGTITWPAGTEIALSKPMRFQVRINEQNIILNMQGLLVKDEADGTWKSINSPQPTVMPPQPGFYIYTLYNPGGPDDGAIYPLPVGTHTPTGTQSPSATINIPYQGEPDAPPCFTPGTLIDTPNGPKKVEDLRAGDLVMTRDHGAQPLIWTGHHYLSGAQLAHAPHLRPIHIPAGALGPGCPARGLVVSPQHRILLKSRILSRITGNAEVLSPACQLVGWRGISTVPAETGVTYLHLMCEGHEVIRADDTWTETLYLGPELRKSPNAPMQREIAALFPELWADNQSAPKPARPFLRGRKLQEFSRRSRKNARNLVE